MVFHRVFRHSGLISALILAECLFAMMVAGSNRAIQAEARAVTAQGHLAAVHGEVLSRLGGIGAAVGGGMFFTLTVGAGLILAARGARWAVARAAPRHRRWMLRAIGLGWAAGLIAVNSRGVLLWPTLAALIVPVAAALGPVGGQRSGLPPTVRRLRWLPVLIAVACMLWVIASGGRAFYRIRDRVLLPHRSGQWVADAYYRYTLYAARVFTPLARRPQVAVYADSGPADPAAAAEVVDAFAPFGWVRVTDPAAASLRLTVEKDRVVWWAGSRQIDGGPVADSLAGPEAAIAALSRSVDIHGPFRLWVLLSLMIASPLGLLWAVRALIVRVACLFLPAGRALSWAAVLSASILALGLAVAMWPASDVGSEAGAIDSPVPVQLAILNRASANQGLMPDASVMRVWAAGESVPVRLAVANAMGRRCRRPDIPVLEALLEDSQAIVVTAAVRALGNCRRVASAPLLAELYQRTDHWYVQDAAFRALRSFK